jgi:hypothetical protein
VSRIANTLDVRAAGASVDQAHDADAPATHCGVPLRSCAVVVPLTISTAVGAATIVGERERTRRVPRPPPAPPRSTSASSSRASYPAHVTTIIGFGIYSLIVNTIVGPEVGGWFFPTSQWWLLMLGVVPPFLLLALSMVLRLSARVKSTAAAQQASGLVTLPLIMIAYTQSTGSLYGDESTTVVIAVVAWASPFRLTRAAPWRARLWASPTNTDRRVPGRRCTARTLSWCLVQ